MATDLLLRAALAGLLTLAAVAARADGPRIERVEPPNWWVGMKSDRLQLLVHGPGIAAAEVVSGHDEVRVLKRQRVDSSNYLFVDLQIGPGAPAKAVPLTFRTRTGSTTLAYELRARTPGSAERRGFDGSDLILNLVPDRFANGDPGNDDPPGATDRTNRADKDGRHGGDLAGMTALLDYIAGMGFTMLWPTPLTANEMPQYSYHGYAATDTYRIDPRFGSNDDYRRFVAAARQRGIGVILDFVPNHIGSGHWWMRDLPTRDWLNHGRFVPTNHARTAVSDRYASQSDVRGFTEGWFVDTMPDPNQRNPLLATYQIQNAIWWVEWAGLAGLRIDTYGYSDKAFLAEFTRRLMAEYPRLNIVGEEWSPNPVVVSYWLRGKRNPDGYVSHLPSVMDFPLHDTLRRALLEPDSLHSGLMTLYEALVNDNLYPEPQNLVLFEGNHDVPRLFSALREDPALWRMALAYVLTMPRIPQLYYGTELLMTSPTTRDDGATRGDFPGGWPGDAVNAVTGAGLSPAQREAQAWLRTLATWRRTQPVVHRGQLRHFVPEDGTYVYFRHDARDLVMVVLNKQAQPRELDGARFRELLPPGARGTEVTSGQVLPVGGRFTVPARSALVLQVTR